MRAVPGLVVLASLAGCNGYDLLRVAGYLTPNFPRDADVLFVVDNSPSMVEESLGLAKATHAFTQRIEALDAELSYDGLDDAVDNYLLEIDDRGRFVDFQIGVTTTNAAVDRGALLGGENPLIPRSDPDFTTSLNRLLLCEATCFASRDIVPLDPFYKCGDPVVNVSSHYLDCLCDGDRWVDNCGGDAEEPVEAVALAMCRAQPDPPEACFHDLFREDDVGANAGLLREGTTFVPIIITDEGDASRREPDVEPLPRAYMELFRRLDHPSTWGVIGPALDEDFEILCPGVATSWGTMRLDWFVGDTGGAREDIHDPGICTTTDYSEALVRMGDLILGRGSGFPLYGPAVESTIRVYVDGEPVPKSPPLSGTAFAYPRFGNGWTYDKREVLIIFHGTTIPDPSALVEVYYLPVNSRRRGIKGL